MSALMRLCRAEVRKMRHTIIPWMHLGIPLLGSSVFLLYYRGNSWSASAQISGYVQILGVVFPLLISIICARSVELEAENHFQTFLGVTPEKWKKLLAKGLVLFGMGLVAVVLAVGIFAAGYEPVTGKTAVSAVGYGSAIVSLWLGSLPLYLFHLFLNLQFSKAASLCVGAVELLVSALFLTGLGTGIWQMVPCSWSARWSSYVIQIAMDMGVQKEILVSLEGAFWCCLLITLAECAILFLWFHFYEGRQCDD